MCLRYPLVPLLALLLGAAILPSCGKTDEAAPAAQEKVVSKPSVKGDIVTFTGGLEGVRTEAVREVAPAALTLPGRLIWNEDKTVRVFSPFAGRVVKSLVQLGDTVKQGQPLVELASAEFGQAQADVRRAAADLQLARANASRAQELADAGIVARKDLQQAQADLARTSAESTRASVRLAQVGTGAGNNFILKAPLAGVVVDKNVNPGQEFRPDTAQNPLFVISDPTALWLVMDANESDLGRLSGAPAGTKLQITSSAYQDKAFEGVVGQRADFVDATTRTFKIRGAVANSERLLKAEMFVRATFPLATNAEKGDRVSIPLSAVMLDREQRVTFVAREGVSFERRRITVYQEVAGQAIVSGVTASDKVVTEGALYLQQLVNAARINTVGAAKPVTAASAAADFATTTVTNAATGAASGAADMATKAAATVLPGGKAAVSAPPVPAPAQK